MKKQEVYRLPTIEIENKDDLTDFLSKNMPDCIFENVEEVPNPVGKQWNYTLTAKIESDAIGSAVVEYKEPLWEKPDKSGIIALWLKEAIPPVCCWYRGMVRP